MMPWVLYSGKMTRSMPGSPSFMPSIIRAILRAFVDDFPLGVQPRHPVVDDRDADGVVAGRNIAMASGVSFNAMVVRCSTLSCRGDRPLTRQDDGG